jgi:predicted GNAT family N-acyltransferase
MTPFTVRRAVTAEDRERAHALRHEVFVGEEGVPEALERDAADETADHVVAADAAGRVVATGRLVRLDVNTGKVGRMAVAREVRGRGAGALVLAELERIARERGLATIVLHAQASARGFYDRLGYAAEGPAFEEAGIEHVLMRKSLAAAPTRPSGS